MATKMVPELEGLACEEILKEMDITTLEHRRERRVLIQIYKSLSKIDQVDNEELLVKKQFPSGTQEAIVKNQREDA